MADIQPKNTNTIRVDVIKEKTASAGISFPHELYPAANIEPSAATVNLGTSTAAQHFLEAFLKEITSNGQALTIGTDSAHNIVIKLNGNTVWTFTQSTGGLDNDSTNGGNLTFNKALTGICHNGDSTFTATGTTQGAAAPILKSVTVITTATGGVSDSLLLPVITSATLFKPVWIANESGATCKIFPNTGANLDDGAANASANLADNTHKMYMPITTTRWLTF